MDDEKKLTVLLDLYKVFKDCMERSKKNVFDTYRIYIPALFTLLVAISQIKEIRQALENMGIEIIYVIPIIGIFILISYAQVVYDLTNVICLGAYLWFLEQKINEVISEEVAFWEKKFGEPLKMIKPEYTQEKLTQKLTQEKLLRYIYIYFGPIVIALAWAMAIIGILGINLISIGYSLMMALGILLFTLIIGHRRLGKAEEFYEKYHDC